MKTLTNQSIGKRGENLAADFLTSHGYNILYKNYHSRYGEIDLIARKEDELIFVEVKTRSKDMEAALNSVSLSKQKKLSLTAAFFLSEHPDLEDILTRFDVIAIISNPGQQTFRIKHLENAFDPILPY